MVFLSRIYTKSGDQGETGLGDGKRIAKDNPQIQAIGEVDELNAVLGIISTFPELPESALLRRIQNELFDLGADLCMPWQHDEKPGEKLRITEKQVEFLEQNIDRMNEKLSELRSFILPGGNPVAAWLHQARTVCRRAERSVVTLTRTVPFNQQVLIYLNRLSDLLFVWARIANDHGKADVLWVPGATRE